jgi:hypothetical protein
MFRKMFRKRKAIALQEAYKVRVAKCKENEHTASKKHLK